MRLSNDLQARFRWRSGSVGNISKLPPAFSRIEQHLRISSVCVTRLHRGPRSGPKVRRIATSGVRLHRAGRYAARRRAMRFQDTYRSTHGERKFLIRLDSAHAWADPEVQRREV